MNQRMKKKKPSKGRIIRLLQKDIEIRKRCAKHDAEEIEKLKERIRRLGFDENLEYIGQGATRYAEIEIKPVPYGCYRKMNERDLRGLTEEEKLGIVEDYKGIIVRELANAMIENNVARILIKDQDPCDPLSQFLTIAARIDAVPWDALVERRRLVKKNG